MTSEALPPDHLSLEETDRQQIEELLAAIRDVLGSELIGAYLHGSAVLGGLRAQSDIDVLAVAGRRMTSHEKRRMVAHLLEVSGIHPAVAPRRPVELTIVVESEICPWVYPPKMDFQYGEWRRERFQRGDVEPWPSRVNPDVTLLVEMALRGDVTLAGPPVSEVFDPIPRDDFIRALVADIGALVKDIESDTRNVVLTLARIWNGVVTGEVQSKEAAAEWALWRLAPEHGVVLVRARDIYVGNEEEHWDDLLEEIGTFVDAILAEIETARSVLSDSAGLRHSRALARRRDADQ